MNNKENLNVLTREEQLALRQIHFVSYGVLYMSYNGGLGAG